MNATDAIARATTRARTETEKDLDHAPAWVRRATIRPETTTSARCACGTTARYVHHKIATFRACGGCITGGHTRFAPIPRPSI